MTQPAFPSHLSKGRKQRLAELADRLGLVRPLRMLHDRGRASLTVLAYHRIIPLDSVDAYPLDLELISATPDQFEWQMGDLRRRMNPVSLAQVMDHLDGKATLPRYAVAITFDDGFRDTHQHAFPILRQYGIPATVFVTTGYIESGEPFWFELAAYLMMRLEPHAIVFDEYEGALPFAAAPAERRRSLRRLHEVLKALPNPRRTAVIREWSQRFAGQIEASAADLSRPITWTQVGEMAAAGIEFGSHTVTHPNLTQLSDQDLLWELSESKRMLEQRIGREVGTLAYPIGTRSTYDARVIQAVQRAGLRLAVSYVPGVNWLNRPRRFELRRQGIGLATTRAYFRALTDLPAWIA